MILIKRMKINRERREKTRKGRVVVNNSFLVQINGSIMTKKRLKITIDQLLYCKKTSERYDKPIICYCQLILVMLKPIY
jgi:hypothetical protein